MIDSHPALVAASPQAPMTDLFLGDDAYHGGAFMLAANFGFYTFFRPHTEPQTPKPTVPFDIGTPDAYQFYLKAGNIANLDKLYLKGSNWLFNDQLKHTTVGVEKLMLAVDLGGAGITERLVHARVVRLCGHGFRACRWCAQEAGQPFDVLGSGSQEELLLDELQPAKTKAMKADPALELCE